MGRLLEGFGVGVISYTVCDPFVLPLSIIYFIQKLEIVAFSCPAIFQPLNIKDYGALVCIFFQIETTPFIKIQSSQVRTSKQTQDSTHWKQSSIVKKEHTVKHITLKY
jgi:hypothetical protein